MSADVVTERRSRGTVTTASDRPDVSTADAPMPGAPMPDTPSADTLTPDAAAAEDLASAGDGSTAGAPDDAVPDTDERTLSLQVRSGLQAGAAVELTRGRRLAIGGAADDDIVLRDPAVGTARCVLERRAGASTLRVTAAPVALDGRPLEPGRRAVVRPGARLTLGDVALELAVTAAARPVPFDEDTASARSVDDRDGASEDHEEADDTWPATTDEAAPATALAAAPVAGGRRLARVAAIALVMLGVGGLVASGTGLLEPAETPRVPIESVLAEPPWTALVATRAGGVLVVDGVLPDREAVGELDALLAGAGTPYANRVETDATLAAKVLDVLRVNAAEATLLSSAAGHVVVATAVPRERDLDELVRVVERDVPALASLDIDNTPPPPLPPAGPSRTDPGKRVALVVSAAPAHVVTEDRSRYFVGAVLPSGHRIVAIADNRVSLERDGQRTELDF